MRVALRLNAIYVPDDVAPTETITQPTLQLVGRLRSIGYGVEEELLHVLNSLSPARQVDILNVVNGN